MPPRDPKLCPALDRAMPADDVAGTMRDDGTIWLVLFGDGEEHSVTVRAWRTDRLGRDVVDVEWYAAGTTWGESYIADLDRIRRQ
jgi:hypothetical protein